MLGMYPVISKRFACISFALGYFVLMVGEDVVDTASMDVKMRAKIFHRHGAALNMPSRETSSPGTIPGHLATGFGYFPQRKILWIMPVGNDAFAHARQHVLELVA